MKVTLSADVNAPSHARAHVMSHLLATDLPGGVAADKVVLIASELVTNAVQAGATTIEVSMRIARKRLELMVTDDAGGWPTPTTASVDDTAGRGLMLVEQLADAWDITRRRPGKAVTASWFVDSDQRTDAGW